MLKAEISRCGNLMMTGTELRRLRSHPDGNGLSQQKVGDLMGLYRVQIERWEALKGQAFEINSVMMGQLLKILGAGSL